MLSAGNGTADSSLLPGNLQWALRPHWTGLKLSLAAPCCLDSAWAWRVSAGAQGVQLRPDDLPATSSHWPAQLLAGLGTPWNTVQMRGTLALHTQGLTITVGRNSWALEGAAAVDALGLSTALSTLQPLGSYRLALQGGSTPQMTLSTLNGKLLLSGQGQLLDGRWRFSGEARSDEASQGALGNLLNIIGRREGARSVITVG
jgi:general secretion pathway protein N